MQKCINCKDFKDENILSTKLLKTFLHIKLWCWFNQEKRLFHGYNWLPQIAFKKMCIEEDIQCNDFDVVGKKNELNIARGYIYNSYKIYEVLE